MQRKTHTTKTFLASALVLSAGAVLFPAAPTQAAPPDTVSVTGTVRDFRRHDAEFVPPGYSSSVGHVAANVAHTLDNNGKPAFAALGFEVDDQWRNSDWQPIAPHLYRVTYPAAVSVSDGPSLINDAVVDTYYTTSGTYGSGNSGPAPQWITDSPMPEVSEPAGMPPLVNEFIRNSAGTTTISGKRLYNKFEVSNGHRILIDGHVVLQVNESFKLHNPGTTMELLPGATLDLYVKKDASVQDAARLHLDTATPHRVHIYSLTNLPFVIQNKAHVSAIFVIPMGTLQMQDQAHIYGRVTAFKVHMQNESGLHIDVGSPADACGNAFADTAGLSGGLSAGGIASAAAFTRWYTDTLDYNLSAAQEIVLRRNVSGIYEYFDDAFLPIDNRLFGNEGLPHNYYFTFAFSVEFVHRTCAGRFFHFEGADDAWAFIDGDLAMDLGGIMPGTEQYIEFDRMGLTDGQTYRLYFFYAQRNPTTAMFRLRTNADLVKPMYSVTASPIFD